MPKITRIVRTASDATIQLDNGSTVQLTGGPVILDRLLANMQIGGEYNGGNPTPQPVGNSQPVHNALAYGPPMFIPGREPPGFPPGYRPLISNHAGQTPVLANHQQHAHDPELDEKPYVYNGLQFGNESHHAGGGNIPASVAAASPSYNGPAYNEDFSPMTNFLLQKAHDTGMGNVSPRVIDDPELREPGYVPPTLNFGEQTSHHHHQTPFFGTEEPATVGVGAGDDPELSGSAYLPPPLFSVGEKRS